MKFAEKFGTYQVEAQVQKTVAQQLLDFLAESQENGTRYAHAYEIGCGTGFFTKLFCERFMPTSMTANDLVDTRAYLAGMGPIQFVQGNIEEVVIPPSDVIVSSSALQWIENLPLLLKRMAEATGEVAFSMYVDGNLQEIKEHFGISLPYHTRAVVEAYLREHFTHVVSAEETHVCRFVSPMAALRHLRDTGVTGFAMEQAPLRQVRAFASDTLTYQVAYFYARGSQHQRWLPRSQSRTILGADSMRLVRKKEATTVNT